LSWDSIVDNIFKVILNEKFELSIFTHWVLYIEVFFLPVFISFVDNIKLNGVISCSDCFDIPVNETQCLAVVNVINVENTEEENEKYKG